MLFTIHQRMPANRAIPVHLKLTPAGRALLGSAAPAHAVRLKLTFTPRHGHPLTVKKTFTPKLLPLISSVQFTGGPSNPTITLRGRGLTPLPARNPAGSPAGHNGCPSEPGNYGSDYGLAFALVDESQNWSAGTSTLNNTSCIGLIPTKATTTEVQFQLGSFYTLLYPTYALNTGDQVELIDASATLPVHVTYGAPVTS